jgi:hypothetical protein
LIENDIKRSGAAHFLLGSPGNSFGRFLLVVYRFYPEASAQV